jgi:hypothetical protein
VGKPREIWVKRFRDAKNEKCTRTAARRLPASGVQKKFKRTVTKNLPGNSKPPPFCRRATNTLVFRSKIRVLQPYAHCFRMSRPILGHSRPFFDSFQFGVSVQNKQKTGPKPGPAILSALSCQVTGLTNKDRNCPNRSPTQFASDMFQILLLALFSLSNCHRVKRRQG